MKSKVACGLLVGAGLMAMAATAQAADAYTASNPFDGFYMGVHAGYGWADSAIDYDGDYASSVSSDINNNGPTGPSDDFSGDFSLNSKGALLGAHAGANFVSDSGLLLGAEVSTSWSDISGQQAFSDGDVSILAEQSIGAIGLAQLKMGFATDQYAIYGLGGLALGQVNTSAKLGVCEETCQTLVDVGDKQTVTGWTVGVGADAMVTENVSIGLAYNYVHFDFEAQNDVDGGLEPYFNIYGQINTETSATAHLVKAAVSYHF